MSRLELAIDPGATGGAWLGTVESGRATTLCAGYWRPAKRQNRPVYKVLIGSKTYLEERILDNLHDVGVWMQQAACACTARDGWRLTIEGLFGRGHTLERLSWYAGLLSGPMLAGARGVVERPLAVQWRRELLGIGSRTPADVCDERVATWAAHAVDGLPVSLTNSHCLDAAALAAWRAMVDDG